MAKNLMIQGTMSGAGKSILTAGLLRVLKQDGFRAAPFKSQNMALNSFVTREGLEMGRAQVLQAQAAGIEPLVCMNPILLKPTNDVGSQVIVNGESIGNMSARDYFSYKKQLVPVILEAYRRLEKQADVIVLEGAGSPAEINLKQEDIVNMGLAELLDAPVLLAGDIDRGGVFAQLIGTVLLLEPHERARVKGLIINKFRGDKTLLDPGIAMLEEKCGIPVTGVIPYLRLDLEEEDSLAERLNGNGCRNAEGSGYDLAGADEGRTWPGRAESDVEIAVLKVPHISNFTDFDQLAREPGVSLRYVDRPSQWGAPDAVLLPGSKNTMADLLWLRRSGLETMLLDFARAGGPVFGICGGYQMLGQRIDDPEGVEEGGTVEGIGLLPVRTVFTEQKKRRQVSGKVWGGRASQEAGGCRGEAACGKKEAAGVETVAYGKEEAAGVETIAYGKEETAGVETIAYGKEETAGGKTAACGKEEAGGVETVAYGKEETAEGETVAYGKTAACRETVFGGKTGICKESGPCRKESIWEGMAGADFIGYEIHMGQTKRLKEKDAKVRILAVAGGAEDGCVCGNTAGTYVHGIFDEGSFRQRFLQVISSRKGASLRTSFTGMSPGLSVYREQQLDRLADAIRKHMDMGAVYRIMGIEK